MTHKQYLHRKIRTKQSQKGEEGIALTIALLMGMLLITGATGLLNPTTDGKKIISLRKLSTDGGNSSNERL